jgi:glucokinase
VLLVGDIGGTRSRLALLPSGRDPTDTVAEASFASQDYSGLEEIVTRFLHGKGERVDRAVFAVAGPVMEGVAQLTNLPWVVAEDSLRSALGVPSMHLINDLLAMAQAIPYLPPDALRTLQCGSSAPGARLAVVAPGTGLGEAFLLWDGAHYIAHPSEGGHADLPLRTSFSSSSWSGSSRACPT